MKSQAIRLVNILVLGPFLVWSGASRRGRSLPPVARGALVVSGIATIAYHASDYLEEREAGDAEARRLRFEATLREAGSWQP